MYDSFANFLIEFSDQAPILWAFLVMFVVAGTGLGLYLFWQLVLRWSSIGIRLIIKNNLHHGH